MNQKFFSTPVLFLIFNRPETTNKVFEKIREIQPRQLFISADGPRRNRPDDPVRCEESREIIQRIDWTCDLHTNFAEENLGCRIAVSSGITWFFNHVADGIILEDDCLPDHSFFRFCESLLETYRTNERVMHIGGANFQDGRMRGAGSYYFSRLSHVWGWATWKRAWEKYDVNIPGLRIEEHRFHDVFPDRSMREYWKKNFELVYTLKKDTWDYQWQYTVSIHNGLAVIPNRNLVSNIGFNENATHTTGITRILANRPTEMIDHIQHPSTIEENMQADEYTFRKYLKPNKFVKLWRLIH